MTTTDMSRLALRLLNLPSNERAALVATLAQGAQHALEGEPLRHRGLTECLSGECLACRVEERLAWVLDAPP